MSYLDKPRRRDRREAGPSSVSQALDEVTARLAPQTQLARIQTVWQRAAGAKVAAEAEPVAESDGMVTIACRSATWAQELDFLGPDILARLNGALEDNSVKGLRFTADAARHD